MEKDLALSAQEVADMLKIAKNTVYELIKRGELNSYRVGKKVRIDLKDVEEYKNRTKTLKTTARNNKVKNPSGDRVFDSSLPPSPLTNTTSSSYQLPPYSVYHADNYGIGESNSLEDTTQQNTFVICGQDILLDILSRHLQFHPDGVPALRSYEGSYNALYALYHGSVQLATTHLWDGDSGEYNTPYVKRMLPGVPAIIINLATRLQGFYVVKGNPKNITCWNDLKRKDITIINREKGSGTRVLLDEHLKMLGINPNEINGYLRESTSHLAIASTVARGGADIGMGNEKSGLQVNGIDFIPLQTERLDLVMKKEDMRKAPFKAVLEIIRSEEFKKELEGIGGYNLNDLGKIVEDT